MKCPYCGGETDANRLPSRRSACRPVRQEVNVCLTDREEETTLLLIRAAVRRAGHAVIYS